MAQVLPAQADTPRQLHYEQVPETKHERTRPISLGRSKFVNAETQSIGPI